MLRLALWVPPGAEPLPPESVRQPALARYVEGWMQRPGDNGLAALVGGTTVGAVWLRLWRDEDRGYGFVDEATPELSMAVRPEWRGRGIGTALLRRVLAEVDRQRGADSLSVSEANPARRLYARTGFVAVGPPEGGAVVMVRRPGA